MPKEQMSDIKFPINYILATCASHLNLLDLITLTILGYSTNYEVPHCGAFSTPHSHLSLAQIFASGSCFKIIKYPTVNFNSKF